MNVMKAKSEEYWKKKLTPEQYRILREKGTETSFTGELLHNKGDGVYMCAACGAELFSSKTKFESGTGWPSFTDPMNKRNVELKDDSSYGMYRIEVTCKNCDSHLGHVFDDGPKRMPDGTPAMGKRYCINSACLAFQPKKEDNEK